MSIPISNCAALVLVLALPFLPTSHGLTVPAPLSPRKGCLRASSSDVESMLRRSSAKNNPFTIPIPTAADSNVEDPDLLLNGIGRVGDEGRRETLVAGLLAAGLPSLSRVLQETAVPSLGGRGEIVDESVIVGDTIVRNLWLNRLAYPVLIVSLENGLFEALGRRSLSLEDLGRKLTPPLPGHSRALEALLAVLSSLDLVHVKESFHKMKPKTVELKPAARAVLLRNSPYYWGAQLLGADAMTSRLRVALRQAQNEDEQAVVSKSYTAKSDAVIESFVDSMQAHSGVTAVLAAEALDPMLRGKATRMLDMAGGSGCFARAFHETLGIPVTVADIPVVVRQFQARWLTTPRVQAVVADLFDSSTWPVDADVHLLANVVHDWGPSQVLQILQASHQSLRANGSKGQLIMIEQLLNDDKSGPLPASLASVSMLLGDWRTGKQYSFQELQLLCREAGFERVERGPAIGAFHHAVIAKL